MLAARYFDGKTAAAHPVSLALEAQDLVLRGNDFELRYPLHEVRISERLGNTPRLLTFNQGGHCEVTDHVALDALLAKADAKSSWLDVMHHSLRGALLSAVLLVVALFAAYRYLLPWGAEILAMRMPAEVLEQMGSSTLQTMDYSMLQPSKLDEKRRRALTARFAGLKPLPGTQLPYHIVFRSAPDIGPNAFALPDGTIVLLDQLVTLTGDDNEIAAVLAHERGHVERRHAMRMALQASAVGLVAAWYLGDVSSVLTALPVVLMEAGYSRDMEREADEYAERTLRLNGLSPCLLTSVLDKLEAAHRQTGKGDQPTGAGTSQTRVLDYLSTHPPTTERAALLCPAK